MCGSGGRWRKTVKTRKGYVQAGQVWADGNKGVYGGFGKTELAEFEVLHAG